MTPKVQANFAPSSSYSGILFLHPGFRLELQSLCENRVFAQLLGRREVRD